MKTLAKYIFYIISVFFISNVNAQGISCDSSTVFCTGTSYNFPAGVNAPAAPPTGNPGPMYGCLGSQPNPAWYYMQVGISGNIEIYMQGSNNHDIDFCCWGPYSSQTAPCLLGLTNNTPSPPTHSVAGPSPNYPSANMVDCSYDSQYQEWCYIPNAVVGQYYVLLITNFSNQPQNIIFSQSNVGQVGAGTANCALLPPNTHNNGPICEGDTLKLTANTIPNAQYVWSGPNNWTSYVQNPVIPHATAMNAGTYYLLFTVNNQISPETQTVVVVKPKPNVIATSDTICLGDTAIITASGANSYIWTPGNLTTASLKLSPTLTSSYKVIGNSLGCKDTATTIIKVNPKPVITANNPSICINDSATLIANGALNYTWSNGILSDSIRVSPVNNTIYKVVGRDLNNCFDSTTSSVTILPRPTIQLTGNTSICLGSHAILTATGGNNYLWNTSPPENTASITVSPTAALTTYTVGVTDINNCSDSASIDVYTIPLPVPTISLEADTICKGSVTTITAGGGSSYRWNTGEITPTISVGPLNTSIYTVTIKTSLNNVICSADTNIEQYVRDCNLLFMPNSFSPSGYNTIFKPVGEIKYLKTYHFLIYNRWGQLVFETNDINQGWDGRFKGEYVQSGSYVYYIFIDNGYEGSYEKVGTVTIFD
ncbi:MAG: gliding motility-associated C-terminal domain-containing protein [Bacteroidales bacterium]